MAAPKLESGFPPALDPPRESVVSIDSDLLMKAIEASRVSPRLRVILPLHKNEAEYLQRMLNAIQPESYIQPHRHNAAPNAESIVVLRGSICYITFRDDGGIERYFTLKAGTDTIGVDTLGRVYHTFFALEPDTVLFEVKTGPYDVYTDKDFAPWAPSEGSTDIGEYLARLRRLTVGGEEHIESRNLNFSNDRITRRT